MGALQPHRLGTVLSLLTALGVAASRARANQAAFEYLARMTPRARAAVPPQGKQAGGSPRQLVNGTGIGTDGTADDSYSGWHSDGTDPSTQWVLLDLGTVRRLETIKVWNYNFTWTRPDGERVSFAHRGVKETRLYHSAHTPDPGDDFTGGNWTLLKTVTLTQAQPFQSNGPDVIALDGVLARWLAIDIRSSYAQAAGASGRPFVGLNEVQVVSTGPPQPRPPRPLAPAVEAVGATDLAATGARLQGNLTAGHSARVTAEWWPEGDKQTIASVTDDVLRNGPFRINANHLAPGTTYRYRLRARNDAGEARSDEGSLTTPDRMRVEEINGDVVIEADTTYVNTHLKVLGNLRLKSGTLVLNGCVVEFLSRYSREFGLQWEGGTLVTNCTTLGGTQRDGINCQGRFDLTDGAWIATDTTVRYTYGICFGSTRPVLYATRLSQGPNPDSIILGRSDARVVLKDSVYNISLYTDSSTGADGRLDLPRDTPFSRVFDERNVPGARYHIEVINSRVPLWWVFFGGIRGDRPKSEIVLGDCPILVPSIIATNLRGTVELPLPWPPRGETHAVLEVGNLTLRTVDKPVRTNAWGIYLSGRNTDVTFRGPTRCCELMVWGGKVRFQGTPGTTDSIQACTTIDIHGDADVRFRNVTFSTSGPANPIMPQITVDGTATLAAEDGQFGKVRLFARDEGTMRFTNCTSHCAGSPLIGEGADRVTITAPPVLRSVPCPRALVARHYRYVLEAVSGTADTDTPIALRTVGSMPGWLSFDHRDGVLAGTPDPLEMGVHRVTLRATAGKLAREQAFAIKVVDRVAVEGGPAAVPGLLLHLDAAFAGQVDDGAAVPGWYDMSGSGHHARVSGGSARLKANAHGIRPAVHFPGSTLMDCGNLRDGLGDVTVVVVSQCLEEPTIDMWPRLVCARPDDGVPWKAPGFQMMAPLHAETHTGVTYAIRVDVFTAEGRTLANLCVASEGITQQYYAGDIFEVLVYGRRLAADEVRTIRSQLCGKYGIE